MSKNKIFKNWIWVSTEGSLNQNKYSVLAVIEILILSFIVLNYNKTVIQILIDIINPEFSTKLANSLFVQNNLFFQYINVSLIILIIMSPVILMKSDDSVKYGENELKKVWLEISWYEIEEGKSRFLTAIATFFCVASLFLVNFHFKINEIHISVKNILIVSGLISFFTFAITIFVNIFYRFHLKFKAKNFSDGFKKLLPNLIFIETIISIYLYVLSKSVILCFINIIFTLLFFAIFLNNRKDDFDNNPNRDVIKSELSGTFSPANWFSALLMSIWLIAVFFRLLIIRIASTIRFYEVGLRCIPKNWKALNFSTDFFSASALMPNAQKVSAKLSTTGVYGLLINKFNSSDYSATYSNSKKKYIFYSEKIILIQSIIIFFIGANIYRFAMKSTTWAWWPMLLYFKKRYKNNYKLNLENRTKITIGWAVNPILLTILLYFMLVGFHYFDIFVDRKIIEATLRLPQDFDDRFGKSITANFHILILIWILCLVPAVLTFLYLRASEVNSLF